MKKNLFKEAKHIVVTTDNYSISFLQRTLGIGYNRAADLMKIVRKSLYKKEKGYPRLISKKRKKIKYIL